MKNSYYLFLPPYLSFLPKLENAKPYLGKESALHLWDSDPPSHLLIQNSWKGQGLFVFVGRIFGRGSGRKDWRCLAGTRI